MLKREIVVVVVVSAVGVIIAFKRGKGERGKGGKGERGKGGKGFDSV